MNEYISLAEPAGGVLIFDPLVPTEEELFLRSPPRLPNDLSIAAHFPIFSLGCQSYRFGGGGGALISLHSFLHSKPSQPLEKKEKKRR